MANRRSEIDFSGLLLPIVTTSGRNTDQHSNDDAIIRFKPGGYPDDMFRGLKEDERNQYECNICFLVAKEPRQCINGHLFCATCIFTWTLSSSGDNRDKCPVCRSPGRYRPDPKTESRLNRKRVVCTEENCSWKGTLASYKRHEKATHGPSSESILPPLILPTMTRGYVRLDSPSGSGEMRWRIVRDPPPPPRGHELANASGVDAQAARGRRRLRHLFEAFSAELRQRRENVDEHFRLGEVRRLDQLGEVESLGRRLDDVSADLDRLMSDMTRDGDRYRGYIRASIQMEDSLLALSQSFPDGGQTGSGAHLPTTNRRRTPDGDGCLAPEAGPRRLGQRSSPGIATGWRHFRYGADREDDANNGSDQSTTPPPPLTDRSSLVNGDSVLPVYGMLADQRSDRHRSYVDFRSLLSRSDGVRWRATRRRTVDLPRGDVTATSPGANRLPLRTGANNRLNGEVRQDEGQGRGNGTANQRSDRQANGQS